jgi:rubrerythrin
MKENSNDLGTCSRQIGQQQVNRTKFKTEQSANEQFKKLLELDVINPSYIVYKCPVCKTWHIGKKEWSLK